VSERALPIIENEVRELLRVRGVDPPRDGAGSVRELVDEVLDDYARRMCTSSLPSLGDREDAARSLVDRVAGLGPLQPFMDDPDVEEIWINGPGKVFCARDGVRSLTDVVLDDRQIRDLVERMLRTSGRRLDLSCPFVDAALQDGSRLHVAIPDITRTHWAVNIRKFVARALHLEQLVVLGSLSHPAADFLRAAVGAGLNVVVSGGTQTGKTTLLNCLAGAIPAGDRVITCEEVFELQVLLPDVVSMQTRQANLEGHGAIPLRRLIVEALRMRPDRIIVGEVREREALDLLIALNSGLPGMTSLHANSAADALRKLTTLPLLAGENVTHAFVVPAVATSVDVVVQLGREGHRRITQEIVGVSGRVEGDRIETVKMFERSHGELRWTGHHPPQWRGFRAAGVDLKEILK
jgi:pilus assembly protein CpaF